MKTTNNMKVQDIKAAIYSQAMNGRRKVYIETNGNRERVIDVRIRKGQLQVRTMRSTTWVSVESITVE